MSYYQGSIKFQKTAYLFAI